MSFVKRVKRSLRGCRLNTSLRLMMFEEEFSFDVFGFLIALPFMDRWHREPKEILESWGVYYHESSIVLCWGDKTKFIYMPWMWDHCFVEVRKPDGSWVKKVNEWDGLPPDGREEQTFPYTYTCNNGDVQNVAATVYAERRTWTWRWFRWFRLPFPRKTRQSIDVQFSDEVGDARGSWKGGCVGCGWDMLLGETMEQTLRRMEGERRFR